MFTCSVAVPYLGIMKTFKYKQRLFFDPDTMLALSVSDINKHWLSRQDYPQGGDLKV